jgi:peptidyl-prolyl cis-trans isomerase SurA
MSRLLLTGVFCLLMVSAAQAQLISKIAVVVNNEVITSSDIDRELEQQLAAQQQTPTAAERQQLRAQARDRLISQTLIRQRIAELKIAVTDEDVNRAIADICRQNKLSEDDLKAALAQQGVSWETYRQKLKQEIQTVRLNQRDIQRTVDVTTQEMRDYYQAHEADFRQPSTIRLNRLSFQLPADDDGAARQVRRKAMEARDRLAQGEAFAQVLAAAVTDGQAEGGDMGNLVLTNLVPDLRAAVENLKEGEVSKPIEVGGRLHLLQVVDRKTAGTKQFDEVKGAIRDILFKQKQEQRLTSYVDELRQNAVVDIRE